MSRLILSSRADTASRSFLMRVKILLARIKKERDAVSARLERIDLDTSKSEINDTKKVIEAIEKELTD